MGDLGAKFIANRATNAFEKNFNDVDVNKSVNHTLKDASYQTDKLHNKSMGTLGDITIDQLSRIFDL